MRIVALLSEIEFAKECRVSESVVLNSINPTDYVIVSLDALHWDYKISARVVYSLVTSCSDLSLVSIFANLFYPSNSELDKKMLLD